MLWPPFHHSLELTIKDKQPTSSADKKYFFVELCKIAFLSWQNLQKFDDVPGFKFSEGMVESGSATGP